MTMATFIKEIVHWGWPIVSEVGRNMAIHRQICTGDRANNVEITTLGVS